MKLIIPNQHNHSKMYLEISFAVKNGKLDICIYSPLSRVKAYYENNINNGFDFSFFDESGYVLVVGKKGHRFKNLLTLLSYECLFGKRQVILKVIGIDWVITEALACYGKR